MASVDKSADLATKLNRSSCSQDDDEEDSSMPYCEPTYKWNVFSWALLWFMNGAIGDAHRRKKERLEVKDTLRLPLDMRCEHLTESFQALWYRYRDDRLRWFKIFGCLLRWELVIGALGEIIYAVVVSGLPFLLQRFVQQHAAEQSLWLTASLIIILCYIRTVFGNSALTASVRASMISRATLVGAMGQKTLRLSSASRQKYVDGLGANILSTDPLRMRVFQIHCNMLWICPIQVLTVLTLIIYRVKWAGVFGCAVMLLYVPLQWIILRRQAQLRKTIVEMTDQRMAACQEVIRGMRIVKYFAWEDYYMKRIESLRIMETRGIRRILRLHALNQVVVFWLPIFAAALAVGIHAYQHATVDAAVVFLIVAMFDSLVIPLRIIPVAINALINVRLGLNRIGEYLEAEEVAPPRGYSVTDINALPVSPKHSSKPAIQVEEATFQWASSQPSKAQLKKMLRAVKRRQKLLGQDPSAALLSIQSQQTHAPFELPSVDLSIPPGSLVMVVGPVGSGKTSLLNALQGQLRCSAGTTIIRGSVGMAQQQAWLWNATVRDNILFGRAWDATRYARVIDDCGLQRDISILPLGDATPVGDRGCSLSGGQRQRIGLARIAYAQPDIILLDDPLSAVDAQVGEHILQKAILNADGMLGAHAFDDEARPLTRVMATHNLAILSAADWIVQMKSGIITAQGPPSTMLPRLRAEQTELIFESSSSDESESEAEVEMKPNPLSSAVAAKNPLAEQKLSVPKSASSLAPTPTPAAPPALEPETRLSANTRSLISAAGGWHFFAVIPLTLLLMEGARVGRDLLLRRWLEGEEEAGAQGILIRIVRWLQESPHGFALLYIGLGLVQGVFSLALAFSLVWLTSRAAQSLHQNMLKHLFASKISFYDTCPPGSLLNAVGQEMGQLDQYIPERLLNLIFLFGMVLSTIVIMTLRTWMLIFPLLLILICAVLINRFVIPAWTQSNRLTGECMPPVTGMYSQIIDGLPTIRALSAGPLFLPLLQRATDRLSRVNYQAFLIRRWTSVRSDSLGALMVVSAVAMAVAMPGLSAATVGLMLTYALTASSRLDQGIREMSEIESAFYSIGRITVYDSLASEPNGEDDDEENPFSAGKIVFEQVSTKHRLDLPLVLHEIDLTIQSGERVGLVGRTGAGKSSIGASLFRMVEQVSGRILIDDQDISKISLAKLRRSIGVVPQEPILFSGSIRENLDPTGRLDDLALWSALEQAHLKELLTKDGANLDHPLQSNNFSLGQRQLFCLARALAQGNRILLMDEATANIDPVTDALLQRTLRSLAGNVTIITVAHRLETIMDYDRVIVLDAGRIVEQGAPDDLVEAGGYFARLYADHVKRR